MSTVNKVEASLSLLAFRGKVIAKMLKLKKPVDGFYDTTWGSKTAVGLARTIERILESSKAELLEIDNKL